MKKYSLIIGIPAHNEERSIKITLKAALKQKRDDFLLKNVAVYSDGSTDQTNNIVSQEKNKFITLLQSQEKKGKTFAIKQLLKYASSKKADFLIIMDADLRITNNNIFERLFGKISQNKNIAAVSGFVTPLKPKNFVERIGWFGFTLWENLIKNSGDKELYFRSSDPLIILRINEFTQAKIAPYSYMHDEFYYLFCRKYGKHFAFEKNATAHFQLPKNIQDYTAQTSRYLANHLSKNENKLLKNSGFRFSIRERLSAFYLSIRDDFFIAISYFFVHLYLHAAINLRLKSFSNKWTHIQSTK